MVKFDYITKKKKKKRKKKIKNKKKKKKKKRELILQIHKFLIIHTENY